MCLSNCLELLVNQEIKGTISADKWSPMRLFACQEDECVERSKIIHGFTDFIRENMNASIDANTRGPIPESNLPKEYSYFCELMRVVDQKNLPRDEKVQLISMPSRKRILNFLKELTRYCQVPTEVIVLSFVFLKKLLDASQWKLRAASWRSMVLTSIRVAQRIEASASLSVQDLHVIYPLYQPQDFLKLERVFLEVVDYKLFVNTTEFVQNCQELLA